MTSAQWDKWPAADKDELDSLLNSITWILVDREPGKNVIDTRWVYKPKLKSSVV